MAKVKPGDFGSARPKLEPEHLDGDTAILTIADYVVDEIDDPERSTGKRPLAMLFFEEAGDRVLYLNKTQIEYLIEGLESDDSEDWVGARVPVEVVRKQYGGHDYKKVWVVPAEDWDGILNPRRRAAKKKSTKKTKRGKRK